MKTEYRGIIAIGLSAVFFILWFTVINPPPKRDVTKEAVQSAVVSGEVAKARDEPAVPLHKAGEKAAVSSADPQSDLPVKSWTLKNELTEVELTSDGGVPVLWKLLDYHQGTDPKSPNIDLAKDAGGVDPSLTLSFESSNFSFPKRPRYSIAAADDSRVVFNWRSDEVLVTKTITLNKGSYVADVAIEVKNLTKSPLVGKPLLILGSVNQPKKSGGFLDFLKPPSTEDMTPVFYVDGGVKRESNPSKLSTRTEKAGAVLWSGLESRYFLTVAIPRIQAEGLVAEYGSEDVKGASAGTRSIFGGAALPSITVTPGDSTKAQFSIYMGPKEMSSLKVADVRLDAAIDYGWFSVIAVPILYLLKFFYGVINNYGIAIILLTIFVKLLLHPINVKSLKSMKAMQQLQPRIKELQKKYGSDKQKLNQETMQLFKAHKVNPMGGCLPMLLQFPIYIALYKVLWSSIELYHAPFFWFYKDLAAPDPYYITPILLGIFMVAQQKLMPSTSADPAQQKMMMLMPVMFSVFMLFLPVGLVVYILVNTVMSVTQQYMYNHGIMLRDVFRGKWKWSAT